MLSSLPILTQAFGIDVVAAAAWARPTGSATPSSRTPPAAAPVLRKSRRERSVIGSMSRSLLAGRAGDGGADARIGSTAADVARHGRVDVPIGGVGLDGQQRGRAHDLAHLAIAALGDVERGPRGLDLLADGGRAQALDGRDLLARGQRDRSAARTHGPAVDVHGARATKGHPATELGAGHPESVSEHPEQRGGGIGVDTTCLAVDIESDHALLPPDGGRLAGRGSDYDARCGAEVKDFAPATGQPRDQGSVRLANAASLRSTWKT